MRLNRNIACFLVVLCNHLLLSAQSNFTVTPLNINTRSKELAPAFYDNGIVFCSDRRTDFFTTYTDYTYTPLTNLYFSGQKKNGGFENPALLAKELTTFMYEGPSCFTRDGNMIYFTRTIDVSSGNKNKSRNDTTLGIFSARKSKDTWTNITGFGYNSPAYNTGYPFISDDGTLLFFCSDMPGGMGGLDIYVSSFRAGTWNKPENLGPEINTSKNDVFPFLMKNGRLYFASRGLNDKGDLDIFYSVKDQGKWQKPVRLPEPFNSANDDYGLIFNASADTGYFVTNRNGSPDIFAAYSSIPSFTGCPDQKENDYCFVFYESNNNEIDTSSFAYEWDMGDGTKVRALEAEHCFAEPGTYMVQLNIIDKLTKDVMVSQATYNFSVEKIEQAYISAPDTLKTDEETSFSGSDTYLKKMNVQNYFWDFGDGSRQQGMETKHVFKLPGTYSVILGVTGKDGTSGEAVSNCVTRKIVVLNKRR